MKYHAAALAAILAAGMFAGCEADDSMPTYPRTVNPYAGIKADDAAAKRSLEVPGRTVPTGSIGDAPRQLNEGPPIPGDGQVVLLQASPSGDQPPATAPADQPSATPVADQPPASASGDQAPVYTTEVHPKGWDAIGHTVGPTNQYNRDTYSGPLPHLPANPGTVPMVGSTPVPGTGWSIDHSWGQVMPLNNYPHRAWPETKGTYENGDVKNNPVYYYTIQDHLNVPQNDGSVKADWTSEVYEVPWWYVNTAILPVLMVLEPPLAQRSTRLPSADPNYNGHLADGPIVPTPAPGELKWEYPFLLPDGSIRQNDTEPATQP